MEKTTLARYGYGGATEIHNQNGKYMRENNGEGSGLTPGQVAEWLREAAGVHAKAKNSYEKAGWLTHADIQAQAESLFIGRAAQVEAISSWNTRHPDPVKAELVEALTRWVRFGKEEGWNGSLIEQAESALKKAGVKD